MSPEKTPNRKDLFFTSGLVLICFFIFRDILFNGRLLFGSDFIAFYLGMKQFLYDQIHANHSIPYWNPYIFGGMPFWAHLESTIFYPLNFLFLVMPPEKAFGYTMFIHFLLGSAFMFLLSRSFKINRFGSFMASLVFILNGFIVATIFDGQMFRIQTYIWIPLIIYFLNHTQESETPFFSIALAGFFWGIQLLAGSLQDGFYTLLIAILFITLKNYHGVTKKRFIYRTVGCILLFSFTGLGIAAIQLIPSYEFIVRSARAGSFDYEIVTMGSYPLEGIITLFMPHFFGSYIEGNYWVSGIPWSLPLYNLYIGILPLILIVFISYRPYEEERLLPFALITTSIWIDQNSNWQQFSA